jgi:tRNA G10  N-methylase Trm11
MHKCARLFENIQFIYEVVLARLELEALGATAELTDEFSSFRLLGINNEARLKKRVAYFQSISSSNTDYFYIAQKNRTRSVNQYLTHWIYPYKGKFHPQMIRAALNIIGLEPGQTVLDPFIGSGTTALEAQLLGVDCIGFDASPLCVLQSKVKTESCYVVEELQQWSEAIISETSPTMNHASSDEIPSSVTDQRVKNFFRLAELVAISDSTRRRKNVTKAYTSKIELMYKSVADHGEVARELGLSLGRIVIKRGDARALPISDNTIDGIITSPPYSMALDYVANDTHALQALGQDITDIREQFVGLRGGTRDRIRLYNDDMKKSLDEMARVLKPGKHALIVIGNATYAGSEVRTVELIEAYAEEIGLRLEKRIDKTIFGLYNVMQREKILIFKKENSG